MGPYGPSRAGWRLERSDGLAWILCEALSASRGVGHAFSTRVGPGDEDFDLGAHDDSDARFDVRRRLLCRVAGLPGQRPLLLRQVHGNRVATGTEAAEGEPLAADGIVCSRGETPGLAAAVRTADCVPILLADSEGCAVAAVHAGWRGSAATIAARAVDLLGSLGVPAERLVAAIGPAIGPCCYEVGEQVAEAAARASGVSLDAVFCPNGASRTLDLPGVNRLQLRRAGLRETAVHVAPWCTACDADFLFSYRRSGGPTGRLMACIGWTGVDPAP